MFISCYFDTDGIPEKHQQMTKKCAKLPSRQRVNFYIQFGILLKFEMFERFTRLNIRNQKTGIKDSRYWTLDTFSFIAIEGFKLINFSPFYWPCGLLLLVN